ncbi:CoA-binding protein [Paucihalobacter ruber]|uniref:CoA-binding protein n=1 Tax=Paucihalobacter ruber TaxID=2567861 RepID=A0A506PLD2_9FLAO|nr:CoA-binding protein [Paucihalobacter ruber]TPV34012.1 CoA-binding protein [Paucihalobacter ruber]
MSTYTLVMGASTNPARYAYMAIERLVQNDISVKAFGLKKGTVGNVAIDNELVDYPDIDTVTLYLGPSNQPEYYNYIINLKPRRVIFNPGTENPEFYNLLKASGIEVEVACTLVLLGTNQY